jgi:hypothetical protein
MARYVNERIGSYVPVSQYMGTLGGPSPYGINLGETSWERFGLPHPRDGEDRLLYCNRFETACIAKLKSTSTKMLVTGVVTGAVGALVLSMVYRKSKGK